MNDYERIAKIIQYLDEAHTDQPSLDELASKAGLSPSHFHRLFSSWASVTPKDFLQCLTATHARERLLSGKSVLDASLDVGLSGPSRLHDLCVNLEGATPGEIKRGGEGWTIKVGFSDSPFGRACIAQNPRGLCHLSFTDAMSDDAAIEEVRTAWPHASLERDDTSAGVCAETIFTVSEAPGRSLKAYVRGTAFQLRVWRALLRIPAGQLVSYGALARAIDQPTAARAVGTAVGRNPLGYLIPCHRVIRETGVIGDYRWGSTRKKAMIARETAADLSATVRL